MSDGVLSKPTATQGMALVARRADLGEEAGGGDLLAPLRALRGYFGRRANHQDVEDLVQDAALRLHARATGPGEAIAHPGGYVMRVARSVLADRHRSQTSHAHTLHEPLEDRHHPVEEISPERVVAAREELAQVIAALTDLPERTRQAFVLHRFEEMTYPQIARHMGISVSAVEKHIMRAMHKLMARMQDI
ncbi:MAG TPA: RNA polymerase sigma factor [Novosphingobium sp.]|nr:RNA polymerase sigma factor [Novosphingobium sp.]